MKNIPIRTIFLIHLIVSIFFLGVLLTNLIFIFPILEATSKQNFSNIFSIYFNRGLYFLLPLYLLHIYTALQLIRRITDHELHSNIRADVVFIFSTTIIGIAYLLIGLFSLQIGYDDTSYRTIKFLNGFFVIAWLSKNYFVFNMIKYFYGFDSAYDYKHLA